MLLSYFKLPAEVNVLEFKEFMLDTFRYHSQMGKFLVTGGLGLIGGELTRQLVTKNHQVVILDDFSSPNHQNFLDLRGNTSVKIIKASTKNEDALMMAMNGVDACFHLAATVGVDIIFDSALNALENNLIGSFNLIKQLSKRSIPTIIASSSEVYGINESLPLSEESESIFPSSNVKRWHYSHAKLILETMSKIHYETKAFPVKIVRLFNTVGPGQLATSGMVIPRFVKNSIEGERIVIFGNGKQTRSFCHVSDCAAALIKLSEIEGSNGQIFNIGSTEEISIRLLAELIIKKTNSNSKLVFEENRKTPNGEYLEFINKRVPNVDKIFGLTGWKSQITLNEIIDEMVLFEISQSPIVTEENLEVPTVDSKKRSKDI